MADDSSAPASSFGQILKDAQEPKTDQVASPQEPDSTLPIQPAPDFEVEEATPSATPIEPSSSPEPPQSHTAAQTQIPISTETPKTSFGDLLDNQPAVKPTINIEPAEPPGTSSPQSPQSPLSPPGSSLDERLKQELDLRRQKANQVRMNKRQAMLDKLSTMVKEKGRYISPEAQEKFNLPQSTLGDYFQDLVEKGVIKKFGKGRSMYYTP